MSITLNRIIPRLPSWTKPAGRLASRLAVASLPLLGPIAGGSTFALSACQQKEEKCLAAQDLAARNCELKMPAINYSYIFTPEETAKISGKIGEILTSLNPCFVSEIGGIGVAQLANENIGADYGKESKTITINATWIKKDLAKLDDPFTALSWGYFLTHEIGHHTRERLCDDGGYSGISWNGNSRTSDNEQDFAWSTVNFNFNMKRSAMSAAEEDFANGFAFFSYLPGEFRWQVAQQKDDSPLARKYAALKANVFAGNDQKQLWDELNAAENYFQANQLLPAVETYVAFIRNNELNAQAQPKIAEVHEKIIAYLRNYAIDQAIPYEERINSLSALADKYQIDGTFNPFLPFVYYDLGLVYESYGQPGKQIAVLKKMIELAVPYYGLPEQQEVIAGAMLKVAEYDLNNKNYPSAINYGRLYVQNYPGLDQAAIAQLRIGEAFQFQAITNNYEPNGLQQSLQEFTQVFGFTAPQSGYFAYSWAYYRTGFSYEKLGNVPAAIENYTLTVNHYQGSDAATEAAKRLQCLQQGNCG